MSLKNTINTVESDVKGIYQYLSDRNYFLPENKNIQNIVPTLRGDFAPQISFAALKQALINGTAPTVFPIGTEIPDIYDGVQNPQIVGTYQTLVVNNKEVAACGLVRKNFVGAQRAWGQAGFYQDSSIFGWLNGQYLAACSADLKANVSEVGVPTYKTNQIVSVSGTMHLLSGIEVGGTYNLGEGQFWELWQQRTGLSSPNVAVNTGRKISEVGTLVVQPWWLRSQGPISGQIYNVTDEGAVIVGYNDRVGIYVLPICWILAE